MCTLSFDLSSPSLSLPPSLSLSHTLTEGARIYGENEDLKPSIIPLLLTNILGEHSYAMGIRFSRPFFISKLEESRYYTLTPWSSSCQPPASSKLVYLPTACVLIAKRPHFKFMKDALSG